MEIDDAKLAGLSTHPQGFPIRTVWCIKNLVLIEFEKNLDILS